MSTDTTIAARVPLDLREDLEADVAARRARGELRPNGEPIDLSTVVRLALRAWVDHLASDFTGVGFRRQSGLLDANGRGGSHHRGAGQTEVRAALKQAGRAGGQRRRALECFEAAGERGLTADEVAVKLAPAPLHSLARRVTDLLQGGLIEPVAKHPDGIWTRLTRAGAQANVYRISGAGVLALTAKRRQETDVAKP